MTDLEAAFLTRWHQLATYCPAPEHEYRFCERRWRFDFAWPNSRVGVECQGGTWVRGRHTRGQGYRNDCEKLNRAQSLGWCVFWVTTGMLDDDPAAVIEMVANSVLMLKSDERSSQR